MLDYVLKHTNNFILATTLLVAFWLSNAETVSAISELQNVGEGTRRMSLSTSEEDMLARTLLGECGRCSDAEVKAIGHVVLNRLRSGRYGDRIADVVTYKRRGVYHFTCWDPRFDLNEAVGRHVDRSRAYNRMRGLAGDIWQDDVDPTAGAVDYFHPAAFKPRGGQPNWTKHRVGLRIGGAVFYR